MEPHDSRKVLQFPLLQKMRKALLLLIKCRLFTHSICWQPAFITFSLF